MDKGSLAELERGVVAPLVTDGGKVFGTHRSATKGSGAVRGIDLAIVGQVEQLLVQAVVELPGQLECPVGEQIGPADVAHE